MIVALAACGPAHSLDAGFALADAGEVADAGALPDAASDAGTPDAGAPRPQCLAVVRTVKMLANDGGAFVCPGTQDFTGRVTQAVSAGGLWRVGLSVCAGDAGCVPRELRIDADPSPVPPQGTELRVRFLAQSSAAGACEVRALVTSPDGTVWLAASSGPVAPVPGAPFELQVALERPPFSCALSSFLTCGTGFVATLAFTGKDGGSSTGPLAQGASAAFDVALDGGTQRLVGANWSSMSFGGCDDWPRYHWVVTPAP